VSTNSVGCVSAPSIVGWTKMVDIEVGDIIEHAWAQPGSEFEVTNVEHTPRRDKAEFEVKITAKEMKGVNAGRQIKFETNDPLIKVKKRTHPLTWEPTVGDKFAHIPSGQLFVINEINYKSNMYGEPKTKLSTTCGNVFDASSPDIYHVPKLLPPLPEIDLDMPTRTKAEIIEILLELIKADVISDFDMLTFESTGVMNNKVRAAVEGYCSVNPHIQSTFIKDLEAL